MKRIIGAFFAFLLLISCMTTVFAEGKTLVASSGMVLMDTDQVYVEITDIQKMVDSGVLRLELFLQNRTTEAIEVYSDYILLNRCVIEHYFWTFLPAMTRKIEYIDIEADVLSSYKIESVDELKIQLQASLGGGEYYEPVAKACTALCLTGKKSEQVSMPELSSAWAQLVHTDENYWFEVQDAKYLENSGCYEVDFLLKNLSQADLTLTVERAIVDGMTLDVFGYYILPYGTEHLCKLQLWDYEFESSCMKDVNYLQFTMDLFFGVDAYAQETPAYSTEYSFFPAKG